MLILTQDKDQIINFDNIVDVYVNEEYDYNKDKSIPYIYYTTNSFTRKIGKYSSIERCKEILQEILSTYEELEKDRCQMIGTGNYLITLNCIYEMPKE